MSCLVALLRKSVVVSSLQRLLLFCTLRLDCGLRLLGQDAITSSEPKSNQYNAGGAVDSS